MSGGCPRVGGALPAVAAAVGWTLRDAAGPSLCPAGRPEAACTISARSSRLAMDRAAGWLRRRRMQK
eukprot:6512640-Heterocapsa_arctica.AAC.1